MRKGFALLICFSLLALMTSCGGGGGDDSTQPTNLASADGIWHGTFTENGYGTYDVDVLTSGGKIIAYSDDAGVIYKGNLTESGNDFSATVSAYQIGGGLFATSTISGTYTEQSNMSGSFSTSYGTNGTISVTFDDAFNQSSSFALVEGTWIYSEPGYTDTVIINDHGEINGTNSDGCIANGVVSLINPDQNIYAIDVDVTQCGAQNGSYDGMATLIDENTLVYCVSSDNYIMLYSLSRQ